MFAIVAATVLSIEPSTHDTLTAFADLSAEPGTPVAAERSPRARLAALAALHALGGLDAGAPDFRWFSPTLGWESEIDHARRIVAQARTAPTLDWLPTRDHLAAEASAYSATAAAWRSRAAEYRARCEWEADREESLTAWAAHFEREAARYADHACRLYGWAGTSWQRPRRVVLAEEREWMGPARWDAREWPR